MADLQLDRGLWNTWKSRGLTPISLPLSWFKPAGGNPLHYRIDAIEAWLASRRGQLFDHEACWREYLVSIHMPTDLAWVRRLAERDGPTQYGVRFTASGFRSYLATLGAEQ